jgi:pimeloyl-ACP methyl ester carboxylesterase
MSIVMITVLVYGGFCALLFLYQEKMIFLRQALQPGTLALVQRLHPEAEETRIATADGAMLHGWFKRGPAGARSPLLIYFGGNAEEVSWLLDDFARQTKIAVALINYRGYGLSEGAPSEAVLSTDAIAVFDALTARPDVNAQSVVLMGRSLGTGVAVYLASQRKARAVVLVSPYDSLSSVAQSHYPVFPVSLLMRHRFDSLSRAPAIDTPLLALAGSRDTLVTPDRSRTLTQAWKGPRHLEELDGAGHNDITEHPRFWPVVDRFLEDQMQSAKSQLQ